MLRYAGSLLPGPINIATNPSCALGDHKLMVKRCSRIISFVVSAYLDHMQRQRIYRVRISDITNRIPYIQWSVSYATVSVHNNIIGYIIVIAYGVLS